MVIALQAIQRAQPGQLKRSQANSRAQSQRPTDSWPFRSVVASRFATRSLAAPDGGTVPATTLQTASLTTIADLFGTVAPTVEHLTI